MCNNYLALPYLQVFCLNKRWPCCKISPVIFKTENGPTVILRFKLPLANSPGSTPVLHTPIWHTKFDDHTSPQGHKLQWRVTPICPSSPGTMQEKQQSMALPNPLPPALSIFTADSNAISVSRPPQAARPCFACRQKDSFRAVLDQWLPAWHRGYKYPSCLITFFPHRDNSELRFHCLQSPLEKCSWSLPPWNLTWDCTLDDFFPFSDLFLHC